MAARVVRETGEPIKGVPGLAEEAARTEEIRGAARRVVDSVNAAHHLPLDQDMLTQSEDDFAPPIVMPGQGLQSLPTSIV
jgi:hypothetical protein